MKIAAWVLGLWGILFFPSIGFAEDAPASTTVSAKLDQVLKGQNDILQKLGEIQQQLEIVKIRATNK